MAGVFVTGTGTDVGKTFVTAALVRHLRSAGKTVDAFKPVVSGFDPANIANSDPGVLLSALGRDVTNDELDRIAPWRFAAPLSPDLAAKAESRSIDLNGGERNLKKIVFVYKTSGSIGFPEVYLHIKLFLAITLMEALKHHLLHE